MNPVEIGTGKSFKGLAAYLLHDQGHAATAERVAWAQSFNLDDADADRAWRLMAATAMSADQLKAAAGIKKGPRAKNTAYHFSLNFNPKDEPSEALQRQAVTSALEAMGLQKYQALAVAHRDTAHKHVHVVVNLIDPETGMSAASKQQDGKPSLLSNTQRKFSQWAQRFEREHGLTVTEGRLDNANKRAQGEEVDARRKPRQVYEQEKGETTDRRRDMQKRGFDKQASALTAEGKQMNERHQTEWAAIKSSYRTEGDALFQAHRRHSAAELDAMKEANKKRWAAMFMRQRSELRDFEVGERSAIGRIWHAAAVFKDRAIAGDMLGGFVAAFSPAERRAIVQRKHDQENKKLAAQIRKQFSQRIADLNEDLAAQKVQARHRFLNACDELKRDQAEARAALKEQWKVYNGKRRAALSVQAQRGRSLSPDQAQGVGQGMGFRLEPK